MPAGVHIALLRGINVGGRRPISMEALRRSFAALGFADVETYIQSGNIVFRARRAPPVAAAIEARLEADFGFAVPVLARHADEWSAVLAHNPFCDAPGIDEAHLHVVFLDPDPDPQRLSNLQCSAGGDELSPGDGVLYLHAPGGYARTKLSNAYLERHLGVRATTRNWATVTRLHAMAMAMATATATAAARRR